MKKLVLILSMSIFICSFSYAQKVEMKVGDKIEVEDYLNKKGEVVGVRFFKQNDQKLKYMGMFKTLEGIDACSENMKLARKHRNGALIMTTIGVLTIPLGYLILIGPIMSKKKKEVKYIKLAIDDYNSSL